MHSTRIKHYIDLISSYKIWRINRKCRIPIDLYLCKVEESITMKKVGDQTIGVIQRRRINKEGNVSRFQEYHTSNKEEEELMTNNLKNGNGNGNGRGNNGCTYKGFVACGPRDFDGTGGGVALTRWIEKMESVIDNSGCLAKQILKYAASSFIGKALTWSNTQVQARGRDAANAMAWNDFKAF
ncbi:hypothetical protein Tco_0918691 [Tanacetum coccineum]